MFASQSGLFRGPQYSASSNPFWTSTTIRAAFGSSVTPANGDVFLATALVDTVPRVLDPAEREAVEPPAVIPAPAPVVGSEGPVSGAPPPTAAHKRPKPPPAMFRRLQSGAGNAAVSALIAERRPPGSAAVPTPAADTDLMAGIAARDPAVAEADAT